MRALWGALAGCCIAFGGYAETPAPQTETETLRIMQDYLSENYPDLNVRIDQASGALVTQHPGADEPSLVYPDNLFKTLRATQDAAERTEVLETFLNFLTKPPQQTLPDQLDQLRPVLRNRENYNALDVVPVNLPFVGDMGIFFVWDKPESVRFVVPDDLPKHGLSLETLDQRARDNFEETPPDLEIEGDGIFYFVSDGFYESSFLLDTELWRGIEEQLGPVLVAAPNRDIIIFTPANALTAKPALRRLIKEFQEEQGYNLSRQLYLFRDGVLQLSR